GGFGPGGFGPPPQPGQVLPTSLKDRLKLSDEQKKQADELQKEVDARLDKLLTDEQKKQVQEPPRVFGVPAPPGGVRPGRAGPARSGAAGASAAVVRAGPAQAGRRPEKATGRVPEGDRRQARQGADRRAAEAAQGAAARLRLRRPGAGGPAPVAVPGGHA